MPKAVAPIRAVRAPSLPRPSIARVLPAKDVVNRGFGCQRPDLMAWWPREMFEARARMRDHVCWVVGSTLEEKEEDGGLACFSAFSDSILGLDSSGSFLTF